MQKDNEPCNCFMHMFKNVWNQRTIAACMYLEHIKREDGSVDGCVKAVMVGGGACYFRSSVKGQWSWLLKDDQSP